MAKELEDLTKEQLIELIKNQQKEADELNAVLKILLKNKTG